jgi:hypothetical protein
VQHAHTKAAVVVYTIGIQISSAIVFLLFAFRTAWPAYAYSIKDDAEAKSARRNQRFRDRKGGIASAASRAFSGQGAGRGLLSLPLREFSSK